MAPVCHHLRVRSAAEAGQLWSVAADAYRRSNHPGVVQEALQLQGGAVAILLSAAATECLAAAAATKKSYSAAECGKRLLEAVQVAVLLFFPSPLFDYFNPLPATASRPAAALAGPNSSRCFT